MTSDLPPFAENKKPDFHEDGMRLEKMDAFFTARLI